MAETDRLRFIGTPKGVEVWGWTGDWPPPERMAYVIGGITGEVAICDPDDPTKPTLQADLAELISIGGKVVYFARRSHSQIAEAAPEGEHWCRAAEYHREY